MLSAFPGGIFKVLWGLEGIESTCGYICRSKTNWDQGCTWENGQELGGRRSASTLPTLGLTIACHCSPGDSHRMSAIIFTCDENEDIGRPEVFSEDRGCEVTFEWKTKVVCPPKKMECKFVQKHKTYDLRLLSSLTGSWDFVHEGTS